MLYLRHIGTLRGKMRTTYSQLFILFRKRKTFAALTLVFLEKLNRVGDMLTIKCMRYQLSDHQSLIQPPVNHDREFCQALRRDE